MESVYVIVLMIVAYVDVQHAEETSGLTTNPNNKMGMVENRLTDTELLMSFVVFRHGDRTPDQEELDKFPGDHLNNNIFFPYGKKALTNKGKQRGFRVGEYLRNRYNNKLISKLYLPDETSVRTTDYARTKMTALTALAAIFPPTQAQRWNPFLNWQPVPYDTEPHEDDDLLYYYNCPRYLKLREKVYGLPEVQKLIKPYESLFKYLSLKTGTNITTLEDVFYLDNLFQTLANVGVNPPTWAQEVMPKIKEITKIEYACQFYDSELIRLSTGILLGDILNATSAAMTGDKEQPNLQLYSAHENNVAALMAAVGVFKPHQPKFGSAILLEFRKRLSTGQYGFTAVYAPDAGGPGIILPISGCGGQPFCDYDTFITLTKNNVLSRSEYKEQCFILDV
ncbi:prostatic acid phosphatase-like [Pararge aegeria]|uniref:acid phosphatase n=1 Tax=Pararge aegeria aegeria TaxID=348720 RepID=A0A8S4SI11_9NEOP|nr:prostatic acid phosphatase-like [Pararge aegeria]CAH2265211.1 jg19768 [Pararge aegeria aegeria]